MKISVCEKTFINTQFWFYLRSGLGEAPVSYSKLLGLLRMLENIGGRADMARLSDESELDIDELFPVMTFARILDLVEVRNGDILLTQEGRAFLRMSHEERAKHLREKLLKIEIFRRIKEELVQKGSIEKEEIISKLLDKDFSFCENVDEAFECLVLWGVYAGIFDYDGEEEVLYPSESDP